MNARYKAAGSSLRRLSLSDRMPLKPRQQRPPQRKTDKAPKHNAKRVGR